MSHQIVFQENKNSILYGVLSATIQLTLITFIVFLSSKIFLFMIFSIVILICGLILIVILLNIFKKNNKKILLDDNSIQVHGKNFTHCNLDYSYIESIECERFTVLKAIFYLIYMFNFYMGLTLVKTNKPIQFFHTKTVSAETNIVGFHLKNKDYKVLKEFIENKKSKHNNI